MDNTLLAPPRARPASKFPEHLLYSDISALDPHDSAYRALTDFQCEYPITVPVDCSIETALDHMMRIGVHALLVTLQDEDSAEQHVVGLITSYEIHTVRSCQMHMTLDPDALGTVTVGEVMTSWDNLSLVKYESLQAMTALDLYEMFQGTGLTHLLVIEDHGSNAALARGLISRASMARRLKDPGSEGIAEEEHAAAALA